MQLEFGVNKQILSRTDNEKIVEKSFNYLYAHFIFSQDWNGFQKKCYINDSAIEIGTNGICAIPYSQLKSPYFSVYVVGTNGLSIITTRVINIEVEKTGALNDVPLQEEPIGDIVIKELRFEIPCWNYYNANNKKCKLNTFYCKQIRGCVPDLIIKTNPVSETIYSKVKCGKNLSLVMYYPSQKRKKNENNKCNITKNA